MSTLDKVQPILFMGEKTCHVGRALAVFEIDSTPTLLTFKKIGIEFKRYLPLAIVAQLDSKATSTLL